MNTHKAVADLLTQTMKQRGMSKSFLGHDAGLSSRTIQQVFSGEHDFKLSTLFAVADRLGLEIVMVPKEAADAVQAGRTTTTKPQVTTKVKAALQSLGGRSVRRAS